MRARDGIVYLVGAGPGDPELITLRGLRCLERADLVIYDRLVDPRLLDEAPPRARRIYAGKRPGHHALRQDEINSLLVRHARAGEVVVRLKGGDPFVFGRGGEEALACAAAGVAWEVVPGLSSAIAVPALAAIPATHRGIAGAFAVVTGHDPRAGDLAWDALARIDTLVVLMGAGHLAAIAALLLAHGRDAATPVAVVVRGSCPDERVLEATLGDVAQRAADSAAWVPAATDPDAADSPATIVVGDVVALRARLHASLPARDRRPLPRRA